MKINEKTKKILTVAASVTMCAAVGFAAFLGVFYNKTRVSSNSGEISAATEEAVETSGVSVINEGKSNGIQLLSATGNYITNGNGASAEYVEDSITLIASYNSDAMNPTFTWSCTNNTNITITPSADTKSCEVVCNSAFGTQATITCTADDNEDVYATCKVDYIKRATNAALTITNSGGDDLVWSSNSTTPTWTLPEWTSASYGTATQSVSYNLELGSFTPTLGTGTISETYTLTSLGYTVTVAGSGETRSYDLADSYAYYYNILYAYTGVKPNSSTDVSSIYTFLTASPTRTITLTFVGDTTGIEYSYTYNINIDASDLYNSVSTVDLNYSAIAF